MHKETITARGEKGFTLIEVLVAMVILSIGIIALTSMQATGIRGNATANLLTTGSTWASDMVERIFALDYDDLTDDSATSVDGKYTITWVVTADAPLPDMKTVNITVSSMDVATQRNVNVEYIKGKYVN